MIIFKDRKKNKASRDLGKSDGIRLHNYRDYRDIDIATRIKNLWHRNNILPNPAEADLRLTQIVVAALDANEKVVAVNTVFEGQFPPNLEEKYRHACYYYRMFIDPTARRGHLMLRMLNAAFDVLERERNAHSPKSLILVAENRKFSRKAAAAGLARYGYLPIAIDPKGQLVFKRDFAPIPE